MEASGTIPSPCVGMCALDEQRQFCQGCHRSLDEIRNWRTMNNQERIKVIKALEHRPRQSRIARSG